MLEEIFGNKPWYNSMTAWATLILTVAYTVIPAIGELGIVSPEIAETLTGWLTKISVPLGILGIRRAATAKNIT